MLFVEWYGIWLRNGPRRGVGEEDDPESAKCWPGGGHICPAEVAPGDAQT
jgi:hypothetical protein